jgi:uncharacterized protein (TIGR02246 family)
MSPRPAFRLGSAIAGTALAFLIAASAASLANRPARSAPSADPFGAQQTTKASSPQAAPAPRPSAPQSPEEKEIRAFDDLYVKDFNSGNAKALVARFTDDAEVIEADGLEYHGRSLIAERLTETFAASPGATMAIEVESIRVLSPDAAREEGRTTVTPPKGGQPVHRRYTALVVKRDGNWLLSSVREEADLTLRPHDHLEVLSWLLGDWIDEGPDGVIRVNCRWSDDANFLIRTFTVKLQGKDVLTVTQRIGWDPTSQQIRSWEFDSEGGFGEGFWGGAGDRWVVKHKATRADGTTISATNTMLRQRPDLVRWTSTDRFIGHDALPDELNFAFTRVPTPPPAHETAPPAPAAPAKPERSSK